MTTDPKVLNLEEQRALVLWPYLNLLEEGDPDAVADMLFHAGIVTTGRDIEADILNHYRTADGYDIEAAAHDLRRYPPIAARIWALKEMSP